MKIMKKVINGKLYNTETATEICTGFFGNFNCKEVTLYRKDNGEYFEHHELDEFGHREWIEPVDENEAKRFAEEQMNYDDYVLFFEQANE